jgi:histidinol-phosphate aminotransferase
MTIPKFKNFNIEAYKPGKSKIKKLKKIIKLSANESALGMSPRAKKIISDKKLKLERYPDGKSELLRREISKNINVTVIRLYVELVQMRLFK